MTLRATLTSKGQFTIPKAIRQKLGLVSGAKVEVELHARQFVVRPIEPLKILALQGVLKAQDDGRPTKEIIKLGKDRAMSEKFKLHRR